MSFLIDRNMESDFGITEYLSDFEGFTCVIKQRFQDFLVHEIDQTGNVVTLTNLQPPVDETQAHVNDSPKSTNILWSSEIDEELHTLASATGEDRKKIVSIPGQGVDKAKRTEIHNAIRQRFSGLYSVTETSKDGNQLIKVSRATEESRKRRHWPSERKGDYCRFVLYKENKDAHFALNVLGRTLGLKNSHFGIAGNKDRRAVTSQLATVYRVTAEKLAAANGRLTGMKLGNFTYCKDELHLGELKGNRFTIVMRNIVADRNIVENQIKKLMDCGFINYYGMQRFGTTSVSTCAVGKAMLAKRWADVVHLILQPRDDAGAHFSECYKVWASTKDADKALAALPPNKRRTSIEGLLLTGLKKHGVKNFSNAFRLVNRNTRTLYVHSVQSLIWNKLVSKRVAKYGRKVLKGDDVLIGSKSNTKQLKTDEEVENADPFELVIPLASSSASFANEEMSKLYEDILSDEGLTRADFKETEKEYAVHGGFREVFVKPADVEYNFINYDDPNLPLVTSDLERINGVPAVESIDGGKFTALVLSFSLPPGSYATMAIRELCRMDTGKQYQSGLNDYACDSSAIEDDVPIEDVSEEDAFGSDLGDNGAT